MFGRPLTGRRVHSLRTAHLETGESPKKLRKILAREGHLPLDHQGRTDHDVHFDAVATSTLLRRLGASVGRLDLATALNASRIQAGLLVEAGLIGPVVAGPSKEVGPPAYAREDVDALVADLWRDAREVGEAPPGAFALHEAARRACIPSMEVVSLVLRRELTWVGRLAGMRGYDAVLVMAEEVRRLTRGPELDGVPPSAAGQALRTNWRAMKALVEDGVIRVVARPHPANHAPVKVVTHEEMRRFRETYVSLAEAAREVGLPNRVLLQHLSERGVMPALTRKRYHATFYRRPDVRRVAGELAGRATIPSASLPDTNEVRRS